MPADKKSRPETHWANLKAVPKFILKFGRIKRLADFFAATRRRGAVSVCPRENNFSFPLPAILPIVSG
jgi:hypothetical protein